MKVEIRFTPDGVPEPLSLAEEIYRVLDAHRGEDIAVLHVGSQIEIADYFVLCTATSTTHVRALTDEVEKQIAEVYPQAQIIIHQDPYGIEEKRLDYQINGTSFDA